ncbi:hypothetical protein [Streptomyces sp. R35]|uniref:Uncharacterized protein n=1 Tax=Streptomyces sp. R35 TaxID=3238630 RepID=A0AB39SLV9_9ACTN
MARDQPLDVAGGAGGVGGPVEITAAVVQAVQQFLRVRGCSSSSALAAATSRQGSSATPESIPQGSKSGTGWTTGAAR